MHCWLAVLGIRMLLTGTKLCSLIAKLKITVWHHPGRKDIIYIYIYIYIYYNIKTM